MLNKYFTILFLFFTIHDYAQLLNHNDKIVFSNYHEALNYSKDTLDKYLQIKSNTKCIFVQKKDSLSKLDFHLEKSCTIRFINYSIFDYKDSLSIVNYICYQLVKNNQNVKSIILTARHSNPPTSKIKYNFSALNPAYLKKWLSMIGVKDIKSFALSDVEKDYNNLNSEIKYLDVTIILESAK